MYNTFRIPIRKFLRYSSTLLVGVTGNISRLHFCDSLSVSRKKPSAGQELQHCKDRVQHVVRYAPGKKSDWFITIYTRTKEYRATFHGEELLSKASRVRHIIYALLKLKKRDRRSKRRKEAATQEGMCESQDTSRLELQGSKDVGTCRDLQSRNYGYTIGNDTARMRARILLEPLSPTGSPTKPRDIRSA